MTAALVPDPTAEPTMQVERVAKALGISRNATYNGVESGEIPSIRIGRRIVVPTAAVRRMLQLDRDLAPWALQMGKAAPVGGPMFPRRSHPTL